METIVRIELIGPENRLSFIHFAGPTALEGGGEAGIVERLSEEFGREFGELGDLDVHRVGDVPGRDVVEDGVFELGAVLEERLEEAVLGLASRDDPA